MSFRFGEPCSLRAYTVNIEIYVLRVLACSYLNRKIAVPFLSDGDNCKNCPISPLLAILSEWIIFFCNKTAVSILLSNFAFLYTFRRYSLPLFVNVFWCYVQKSVLWQHFLVLKSVVR